MPASVRAAVAFALSTGIAAAPGVRAAPSVSFSITPVHQLDAGLDSGGEVGFTALLASLGISWRLDPRASLGARLRLDYEEWHFDGPRGFGGTAPWTRLYRAGVSVPYGLETERGWRWGLTPTIEYSGEAGARLPDAVEYGFTASVSRDVRPHLTLGLGVGVFERIEDRTVFPYLIIDWRISERLRLTNPFAAGPAGPAGLELSYRLPSGWTAGVGAAYRSYRYRLDEDGPFPGGVGEHRFVPLFVQLGRDISKGLALRLYAGVAAGTRLGVEDARGRRLNEEDADPSATLGVSLIGRF
ncbi:MAG: hypothetical protein LJE61_02360 [Thiocapsa sp.]|jgi:hypothetical protein|nr:hypothetical protein [Thiocapsa sp.]MCG6897911.1 hypothetical protein [Thiocapsa sp.]MCG6984031.1 hypothetical protein [Thiocapsa sp.]